MAKMFLVFLFVWAGFAMVYFGIAGLDWKQRWKVAKGLFGAAALAAVALVSLGLIVLFF